MRLEDEAREGGTGGCGGPCNYKIKNMLKKSAQESAVKEQGSPAHDDISQDDIKVPEIEISEEEHAEL